MKKILYISFVLFFITTSASAQRISVRVRSQRYNNDRITRPERFQLRQDALRLKLTQRNARRDGIITPVERVRIHKAKAKTRRDVIRFKRNGRNRII